MGLKENWVDRVDGVDDVLAEDINSIAHAVIALEGKVEEISSISTYDGAFSGGLKVSLAEESGILETLFDGEADLTAVSASHLSPPYTEAERMAELYADDYAYYTKCIANRSNGYPNYKPNAEDKFRITFNGVMSDTLTGIQSPSDEKDFLFGNIYIDPSINCKLLLEDNGGEYLIVIGDTWLGEPAVYLYTREQKKYNVKIERLVT